MDPGLPSYPVTSGNPAPPAVIPCDGPPCNSMVGSGGDSPGLTSPGTCSVGGGGSGAQAPGSGGGGGGGGVTERGRTGSGQSWTGGLGAKSNYPVRYFNGSALLWAADLSVPGNGFFGHVRYYCNQAAFLFDGPNGFDWFLSSMPYAVEALGSIAIVIDPNNPYWFDTSGGGYAARYGLMDVRLSIDPGSGQITFANNFNGRTSIYVFRSLSDPAAPGQFVSYTDPVGLNTTAIASGPLITQLSRSIPGTAVTDALVFDYIPSGPSAGKLQSALWQRDSGAGFIPQQRVSYAYWPDGSSLGNLNDLQSAAQQLPDGSGGWNTTGLTVYRYYTTGFLHGLKFHFGPEACRLLFNDGLDPLSADDAAVQPYADHYFVYDGGTGAVLLETAAVCPGCPGGGTTSDAYEYASSPFTPPDTTDPNLWVMRTIQSLPDSSAIIVYSNYCGLPILYVRTDSSGSEKWCTFYRYDDSSHLIFKASPSAVGGYDESYGDLVNFAGGGGSLLNASSGLVEINDYYSSGGAGTPLGYLADRQVQQGQGGTPVMLESYTYASNSDELGNVVNPLASVTQYPTTGSSTPTIVTSYDYAWTGGTNQLTSRVTTLPVIDTGQNGGGSGWTATISDQFDVYGNLIQRTDAVGMLSTYSYDVTLGRMTQQVLNAGGGGTGSHVTTDFSYDNFGRLIQTMGPSHTVVVGGLATSVQAVTWMVYVPSIQPGSGTWGPDQTWTGRGYASTPGPDYGFDLVDPVTLRFTDKNGRLTDLVTSKRTSGYGPLSPTDTFDRTDWQSWSSVQYNAQHQKVSSRVYHLIPSSGTGTVGTNYGETEYGYDALERLNRQVAAGGTITRTIWTATQWVAQVWVGTDDTGATDDNPAGSGTPNNMVKVTENEYDGGSAGGDGNLTQQTQYVSATSGDTRVTAYEYDFRDRRVSMTDAVNRYTEYTYDNLDRPTETDNYDSSGGTRIGKSTAAYDDMGRVYQTMRYAVDPSTGTVGDALIGNNWYDRGGNLIQSIAPGDGQVFTKTQYNGVDWVVASYRGYNTTGVSYDQAITVSGDIIVTQNNPTYDEAGNVLNQAMYDRLNDASGSATGELNSSTARISYTANWFDGADRTIASANYGALDTAPTIPSTPEASSDTILVSLTSYNDAGLGFQTTDPKGIVQQTSYDAAGRTTQTIEDYGTGKLNRTTNTTYTLDNLVETLTAVNSTTGDQTTTYTYGTDASSSSVVRNDLLVSVAYPDSVSGSDVVSYAYNRLAQTRTITDQRGTVRTIYYDKLGRVTNDCVTTNGTGTDVTVKQIATAHEIRGMANLVTSYNSATQNSGTVLNQVKLTYNNFGQLTEEDQSHSGAVGGSTPSVQYGYDSGGSSSNEIRATTLTYPNGRVITNDYGTSGAMNDYLNRIQTIHDTTNTVDLSTYTYMGSGMVVRITYPQPSVWLDLWGGTSGTYAGLDLFNRIIDQRWQKSITGTPVDIDRYQYGYDRNSNRLWKGNVVAHAASVYLDEAYAYDNLNRLTQMQRGNLSGGVITGTPVREMDYGLDPTGNWSTYLTKTSGTTDLNQTRTANKVNEITAIGGTPAWATPPAHDAAGNMTSFPQPNSPSSAFTATYDAWNRMTAVSAGGSTVATYQYDGRGRRIVKYTASIPETRHFYYTDDWQDAEERTGTSTSADFQYVWGVRYVDELVCRDDATPQRLYACQDANFNLTSITSTGGSVVERYLYDPYGAARFVSSTWASLTASAFGWTYLFQGQVYDAATDSYLFRRRPYGPALGKFLNRNPWGYIQGRTSLYDMCVNNPVVYVEPWSAVEKPVPSPGPRPPGIYPVPPEEIPPLPPPAEPPPFGNGIFGEILVGIVDVVSVPVIVAGWFLGPGATECGKGDIVPPLPRPPDQPRGPCEFYLAWCLDGATNFAPPPLGPMRPKDNPKKYWNSSVGDCARCYNKCQETGNWPFEDCSIANAAKQPPRWPGPKDPWKPIWPDPRS